ncbi:MAG: AI-2E family transporter [Desulfobacterales bacterium]|jgi:predicted PurR-regulated permease PerM
MKANPSRGVVLWAFLLYFLMSMVLIGWLFWPFLSTIVMAAVVTGLFNPVYRWLCRKVPAPAASLATCAIVFIVVFVPIAFVVGILAGEALELYEMGRNTAINAQVQQLFSDNLLLDRLNRVLDGFGLNLTGADINRALSELVKTVGFYLYRQANTVATNILRFLGHFFFMLVIAFYLLMDGRRLLDFLTDLSPLPDDQDDQLIRKFKDMAGAILIGNGLGGIVQGVLGGGLFAVFGLKSPILWGVIMGLLAFLPIVGIGFVILPAAVFLMLKGSWAAGFFFIAFWAVLSFSVEYVLKPKLVGSQVQMHTLLVFLSIIGGLRLFGILGIIYGPLVVTAFLTLTDMYHSSYQQMSEPSPP